MPGWHAATAKWVEQKRLVVLGIAQEHHANRCRLFAQWQGLDFPILHDPINLMESAGVPLVVAIDEHGIVRATRLKADRLEADFLDKTFPAPDNPPPSVTPPAAPDVTALRSAAERANTAAAWRALGDALALWHAPARIDDAIDAYSRAVRLAPRDGDSLFRLGVCHSLRSESKHRRPGDFQAAADRWGAALETNPNQYVWRRRIQQYGPRLDKPYPFYDWVERAATEIAVRGETPVALAVRPTGSERSSPIQTFSAAKDAPAPDPAGRLARDAAGLVEAEIAIVPSRVKAGGSARVHVTLRPNAKLKAHWNNAAEPLRLWVAPPKGWQTGQRLLAAPQPKPLESNEARRLDFDLRVPPGAPAGPVELPAYALYYVCEDINGTCALLRQDFKITIHVSP